MISGLSNNLDKTLALGEALQAIAKNEGWLKEQVAHAFADLLLFCSEHEIPLREIPTWANQSSWMDRSPEVRILSTDLEVPFEDLLGACTKATSSMIELETKKLRLRWKKSIPIPMTQGSLQVNFDLVSGIPETYREALRAAGSLREVFEPGQSRETIQCESGGDSDIPF